MDIGRGGGGLEGEPLRGAASRFTGHRLAHYQSRAAPRNIAGMTDLAPAITKKPKKKKPAAAPAATPPVELRRSGKKLPGGWTGHKVR